MKIVTRSGCNSSLLILLFFLFSSCSSEQELELGVFSGSLWNVPNWRSYEFFDQAISKFTEENPQLEISYRSGTLREDYSEWLSQKILNGQEPDLFLVLPEDFIMFASLGIIENLDPYMDEDAGFDRNAIYLNALKSGQYDGKQFGMALEVVPTLMFVNQSLLNQYNLQLPSNDWTWSDLESISTVLSSFSEVQAIKGFDWRLAAYTNGQSLFSMDGKEAFLSSPAIYEAIEFAGRLNALNTNGHEFQDGMVAFSPLPFSEYRAYAYFPYSIQKYENFSWRALLLPRGPKGSNGGELKSLLMVMSSRSPNKEMAWEFLKFLATDLSTQASVFSLSHGVPVLREVLDLEETEIILRRGRSNDIPLFTPEQIGQSIEKSMVLPQFEKFTEALDLADEVLQTIEIHPSRLRHQVSTLNSKINEILIH